jgi:hypothetical protein
MMEANLLAVRAARDQLAAEVEQLRVACQYQEDLFPHCRRPGSAATTSRSAATSGPGDVSSPVILSRPRKRWAPSASRSARARSRWRRGRPRGWGLPAGKVARLLDQLGVTITPGGVTQALARTARRLQPTCAGLVCSAQASPLVATDEAGQRVGGRCRATNGS